VTILKLLAPTIIAKLDKNVVQRPTTRGEAIQSEVDTHKIDFKFSNKFPFGSSLSGSQTANLN
jgi:hypothetical protein